MLWEVLKFHMYNQPSMSSSKAAYIDNKPRAYLRSISHLEETGSSIEDYEDHKLVDRASIADSAYL